MRSRDMLRERPLPVFASQRVSSKSRSRQTQGGVLPQPRACAGVYARPRSTSPPPAQLRLCWSPSQGPSALGPGTAPALPSARTRAPVQAPRCLLRQLRPQQCASRVRRPSRLPGLGVVCSWPCWTHGPAHYPTVPWPWHRAAARSHHLHRKASSGHVGFLPSQTPLALKTPVLLGLCLPASLTVLTVLAGAPQVFSLPHTHLPTPARPRGLSRPGLASMANCNMGPGFHLLPKTLLETPSWLSPGPRAELWGHAGPCSRAV